MPSGLTLICSTFSLLIAVTVLSLPSAVYVLNPFNLYHIYLTLSSQLSQNIVTNQLVLSDIFLFQVSDPAINTNIPATAVLSDPTAVTDSISSQSVTVSTCISPSSVAGCNQDSMMIISNPIDGRLHSAADP